MRKSDTRYTWCSVCARSSKAQVPFLPSGNENVVLITLQSDTACSKALALPNRKCCNNLQMPHEIFRSSHCSSAEQFKRCLIVYIDHVRSWLDSSSHSPTPTEDVPPVGQVILAIASMHTCSLTPSVQRFVEISEYPFGNLLAGFTRQSTRHAISVNPSSTPRLQEGPFALSSPLQTIATGPTRVFREGRSAMV